MDFRKTTIIRQIRKWNESKIENAMMMFCFFALVTNTYTNKIR